MALTNQSGSIEQEYFYNAWGERRDPEDWAQPDTRSNLLLDRGYTAHEHLAYFNLINMNGRVYDAITARFLSPDPVYGSLSSTQSLNKYSYVLNNPLRYTDPSGYLQRPNTSWIDKSAGSGGYDYSYDGFVPDVPGFWDNIPHIAADVSQRYSYNGVSGTYTNGLGQEVGWQTALSGNLSYWGGSGRTLSEGEGYRWEGNSLVIKAPGFSGNVLHSGEAYYYGDLNISETYMANHPIDASGPLWAGLNGPEDDEIDDRNELTFEYGLALKQNFRILGIGTMFKVGYTGPIRTQDFTSGEKNYGGQGSLSLGVGIGFIGLSADNIFSKDMISTFNLGPFEWSSTSTTSNFGLNLIDIGVHPILIGAKYSYFLDLSYSRSSSYKHPMYPIPDKTRVELPPVPILIHYY